MYKLLAVVRHLSLGKFGSYNSDVESPEIWIYGAQQMFRLRHSVQAATQGRTLVTVSDTSSLYCRACHFIQTHHI